MLLGLPRAGPHREDVRARAGAQVTDALEIAGQRAANEALRLWALDIVDFPITSSNPRTAECLATISDIIRFCGWLPAGGYLGGRSAPQWCGITAGWCWAHAGLDPRWLQVWFASTMRLVAWACYQSWNEHKNPRPPVAADRRLYQGLHPGAGLSFTPRAGDVVIVGDGRDRYGQHVTVCITYDDTRRTISTISGNGGGYGPHGGPAREGISQRDYTIDAPHGYRAMHVIRPAFGDLLCERP